MTDDSHDRTNPEHHQGVKNVYSFSPTPALGTCRFWCGSGLCTLQIITHSYQLLVHGRLTYSVFLPYSVSAEHNLHCVSVDHSLLRISV